VRLDVVTNVGAWSRCVHFGHYQPNRPPRWFGQLTITGAIRQRPSAH